MTGSRRRAGPGWLRGAVPLLGLLLAFGGPRAAVGGGLHGLHELHESYADMAIEGEVVGGTIRFFKNDLERALGPMLQSDAVSLTAGAEADALVLRYLRDHLTLVSHGDTLAPILIGATEIELGHHTGWQLTLAWTAPAPIDDLHVRSTLLFDIHDDQRNIMRFVRLPDDERVTLTLEPGAEAAVVSDAGERTGR